MVYLSAIASTRNLMRPLRPMHDRSQSGLDFLCRDFDFELQIHSTAISENEEWLPSSEWIQRCFRLLLSRQSRCLAQDYTSRIQNEEHQ